MEKDITDFIKYAGVYDTTLDLFESQYKVPNGMAYNSYVILDDKIAIMDTVDKRASEEWLKNIEEILDGRKLDYVVVLHMEPDHSYNLKVLCDKYPDMKIVGNDKTFSFIPNFFNIDDLDNRKVVVTEGSKLELGNHTLNFIMAPMVHWPEVMVAYEESEKVLFSADAFGRFGSNNPEDPWLDEARRFYINIVAKYGPQVQMLLKKAANLDIKMICSLHGSVLKDNLSEYIEKYNTWSSYMPEEKGTLLAYASIHGNTNIVAEEAKDVLEKSGEKVVAMDLTRCDMSEAIANAFRFDKIVLAAASYNMGVFPPMEMFLRLIKAKNIQNKKIALIENGSWAPSAGRVMKEIIGESPSLEIVEPLVTIRTTLKENDKIEITKLIKNLLN